VDGGVWMKLSTWTSEEEDRNVNRKNSCC
jgi:hypothetical protein